MGYYTKYDLTVKGENGYDVYEHLLEDNDEFRYSVDNGSSKWYNHELDIKDFSKKYPTNLFVLEGYGEEDGDIWRKYFMNGKIQIVRAKIVFDEFDENKLI